MTSSRKKQKTDQGTDKHTKPCTSCDASDRLRVLILGRGGKGAFASSVTGPKLAINAVGDFEKDVLMALACRVDDVPFFVGLQRVKRQDISYISAFLLWASDDYRSECMAPRIFRGVFVAYLDHFSNARMMWLEDGTGLRPYLGQFIELHRLALMNETQLIGNAGQTFAQRCSSYDM